MAHKAKAFGAAVLLAFLSWPLLYYSAAVFELPWLADFMNGMAKNGTNRRLFFIVLTFSALGLVFIADKFEKRDRN